MSTPKSRVYMPLVLLYVLYVGDGMHIFPRLQCFCQVFRGNSKHDMWAPPDICAFECMCLCLLAFLSLCQKFQIFRRWSTSSCPVPSRRFLSSLFSMHSQVSVHPCQTVPSVMLQQLSPSQHQSNPCNLFWSLLIFKVS